MVKEQRFIILMKKYSLIFFTQPTPQSPSATSTYRLLTGGTHPKPFRDLKCFMSVEMEWIDSF